MANQKILFISEMKDMKVDASSTQIMTYNLLQGFHSHGFDVTFIAVCNDQCDTKSVIEDYSPIVNRVECVPSALNLRSRERSLLSKWLLQLEYSYKNSWYKNQMNKLHLDYSEYQMLITHLPAIESAFYAQVVKRAQPDILYIQYWSDPFARTGLAAGQSLPKKRALLKYIERRILKQSDRIVYGTDLLRETQAKEYPKLSSKMKSCDVSYNVYDMKYQTNALFHDDKPVIGYVGSYVSTYRNIEPLYGVFKKHPGLGNLVLCGYGDQPHYQEKNMRIIERCSPMEAVSIEKQLDIHVCLLNITMSQIPGKIFYQTNSGKPILVILDGVDKEKIKQYLLKFNRFEFSENNEESILQTIQDIKDGKLSADLSSPEMLSPERFAESVIGK